MKTSLKKRFQIIGSALVVPFLMASSYAGYRLCQKGPQQTQKTQKTSHQDSLTLIKKQLDEKGFNVTWSKCENDLCSSVEVARKIDDGFIYRYDNDNGELKVAACVYNKNSPVVDQNWAPMIDRFKRDAEKKFAAMEFRAVSTFNTPGWESLDPSEAACKPTISATFLLKADGKMYSAVYKEQFSSKGDNSLRENVIDLTAIGSQPKSP